MEARVEDEPDDVDLDGLRWPVEGSPMGGAARLESLGSGRSWGGAWVLSGSRVEVSDWECWEAAGGDGSRTGRSLFTDGGEMGKEDTVFISRTSYTSDIYIYYTYYI